MAKGRVYGQKCTALLAKYDQDMRSLRTYQCSFIEELNEYSATLPRSGTIVNGRLSEQTKWELGIEEKGSGYVPTPDTMNHRDGKNLRKDTNIKEGGMHGVSLHHFAAMFPTPTVADTFTDKLKSSQQKPGSMHSVNLSQAVHMKEMFPTPTVDDSKNTGSQSQLNRKKLGKKRTLNLNAEIVVRDKELKPGDAKLNPMWVEWLMGFPIGWTDLEDSETQ